MAERLLTSPRTDDEMLTTVMHPTGAPAHEHAAPLTPAEAAAFASLEARYYDTPVASASGDLTAHDTISSPPPVTPESGITVPGEPTDGDRGDPTEVAPEAVPPSPEFTLVMVDQSKDARDFARDAADARLTSELNEGGRFRRLLKGVWKGGLAKDYYRQKYVKEAQSDILASQDVLVHATSEAGARSRAKQATIERFQSEYEEMINRGADEKKWDIAGDSELATSLKGVIREYAEGRLSDAALLEERTRVVEAYREAHGDEFVGEGLVKTDNILDIAQAVKGAIEHGESLDNVLTNMKIVTGEARTGARTEAHYTKVDKAVEWMSKRRMTAAIPESALILATSIASGVLRIGSVKTIGAIGQTIIPGIGGALIAGVREWKHVKDERSQHSREVATGQKFVDGAKRREEMEDTRYESMTAQSLIDSLRDHHASIYADDAERPAGTTKDSALQAALDALTAVEVRNLMADSKKMDLIMYSDVANMSDERMQLALARAELKVALRNELDDDARGRLGIDAATSLEGLIEEGSSTFIELINEDISAKDEAFKKLRNRRVAGAAAIGLLSGVGLGLVAQEAMAAIDPSDTRAGLVEQLWNAENKPIDGVQHQSILHGVVHGDHEGGRHAPSAEYASASIGEHGTLELSNDHSIVTNPDGTLNFVDPNGNVTVENLPVNDDGSLSAESIALLESKGMMVEDVSTTIDKESKEARTVDYDAFMENHRGDTTEITRDGWYDNNTPAPVFDKNELGLQWGGKDGTGITKTGYQLNLDGMTENGSYHGDKSVNYQEAIKAGKIEFDVSTSKGEQTTPFTVDVNPDGTIDIPKDSPAGQFFSKEDGRAVFNGQYGEVNHVTGVDEDGVKHVRPLATIVGTGDAQNGSFHDIVTVHTPEKHPGYKITTAGYDTPGTFTEMAPVIPVVSRRAMENMVPGAGPAGPEARPGYYGGYYGGYMTPEQLARARSETSPRLLNDPERNLNPGEELSWYRNLVRTRRGEGYVNKIDAHITASPELSSIGDEVKAIITIPIAAASEAESKGIYNVLAKAYSEQKPEALGKAMVLINVNYFQDLVGDPESDANIARTKSEIERAKKDFPQLRIATIEQAYDREEAKRTGGVIGHAARDMYDTAMFAAERAISEGRRDSANDLLIIRNDADPKGVDRNYIGSYLDALESDSEADVFTGTLSYDTQRAHELPGFVFATNFMQSMNVIAAVRDDAVHFVGVNSAMKASAMAAAGGMGFDEYSGAGSDDVFMGRRIVAARRGQLPSGGSGSASGYYSSPTATRTTGKRKVGHRVRGARIESDSDRLEATYRQGRGVAHTWDGGAFDGTNGYVGRSDVLNALGSTGNEDLARDPDSVIEHIRTDMEATINANQSESLARTALAFVFSGMPKASSDEAYTLRRDPASGRFIFAVTPKGRQAILNTLTRASDGTKDPYGERKARQLFGETSPGATRVSTRTQSQMIRV